MRKVLGLDDDVQIDSIVALQDTRAISVRLSGNVERFLSAEQVPQSKWLDMEPPIAGGYYMPTGSPPEKD